MTVHSPSIVCSEGIYENAAVLKSSSMASPVTTALEKYEFGQEILHDDSQDDSHDSPGEKETLSDDPEERSSDQEAVSFQVTGCGSLGHSNWVVTLRISSSRT